MLYQFESFAGLPLRHAMSQRRPDAPAEGDVGYTRESNAADISANRDRFLSAAGVDPGSLTLGRQVHGARVEVVSAADRGRGAPPDFDAISATDGLLTSSRAVAPAIFVADCVPIVLYDPVQHALGVVHAGWRGTVAGIGRVAVEKMTTEFGSRPVDIKAGIGPSIGPCCYEVGHEVIDAWEATAIDEQGIANIAGHPRPHFDLWRANRLMLLRAGLCDARIETAGVCTKCESARYFSHRAAMAAERPAGRMIMVAQLT